ncbi:head-tail connector protein [Cytobacillus firmus]|uniref:head-tail connector protein n=1 Tax=Cytobacillus firmus TaxID=1399 RepID=UPI00369E783D
MLEEIKITLRIDGSEEDIRLTSLVNSVKAEIKNSTSITVDESNDFHKTVITLMVMKYYDTELAEKLDPIINRMLVQLQYQPVEEV